MASEEGKLTSQSPLLRRPSWIDWDSSDNLGHHMEPPNKEDSILANPEYRKGYISGAMTMCLGILGGGVLPVSWAFSITGAAAGICMVALVAWANAFTSDLLIRQCFKTGTSSYEELSMAVGGHGWLFITQVSILILQAGSCISAILQVGESAVSGAWGVWGQDVPHWFTYKDSTGAVPMLLFTAIIAFPLCLVRQMRSLENVGYAGFVIVVSLGLVVMISSCVEGLPALVTGELQLAGFDSIGALAQAASVFGFVFVNQTTMILLLLEMPGPPRSQARILSWAQRFTVLGFCFTMVTTVGFFGAAWFGKDTQGNILQNTLLGGGLLQGLLNILVALYITFVVPPMEIPAKNIVDSWLPGDKDHLPYLRHFLSTTIVIVGCLGVAIFFTSGSNYLLVVTGATGVFMVAYLVPILNHFLLYFGLARCQHDAYAVYRSRLESSGSSHGSQTSWSKGNLLPAYDDVPPSIVVNGGSLEEALIPEPVLLPSVVGSVPGVLTYRRQRPSNALEYVNEIFHEFFLPIAILVLGFAASAASLWTTFSMPEETQTNPTLLSALFNHA
eukprot:TRINITY_DN545_c0_g1_i1.p1 TRINITY_DN545_c0_g1~~TRINITY_DN545_c0_g1_i1.p1  ORF type:complete len:559 (+),score=84.05 TRINITY_DN545_c0_g1_i1:373-2049(+)